MRLDSPEVLQEAWCDVHYGFGLARHVGVNALPGEGFDQPRRVDAAIGCSLLVAADALARVGLLDEAYFAYHEEIDWCVRARKAGYYLYYQPFSRVYHHYSKSTDVARPRPHAARRPQGESLPEPDPAVSGTRCGPTSARATPCASSAGTPGRCARSSSPARRRTTSRSSCSRSWSIARRSCSSGCSPIAAPWRATAWRRTGWSGDAPAGGRRGAARARARAGLAAARPAARHPPGARGGPHGAGRGLRARPLGRRPRPPAAARAAGPAMTGGVGGRPRTARGGAA